MDRWHGESLLDQMPDRRPITSLFKAEDGVVDLRSGDRQRFVLQWTDQAA